MSVATTLPWTGERMVPFLADPITEAFHWQRYLYFRPWYSEAKVVDAACGEGYGSAYAATFAESVVGIDVDHDAVRHARTRYPFADFQLSDVAEFDYSGADLVLSFETIEHLEDPNAFLQSLRSCTGRIVISTPNRENHSPGNGPDDKPLNPFHTVEWTPREFAALVQEHFPDRQVRFLSQENRWPGRVFEGLDDDAKYTIAVIGDGDLPQWPKIGLAMPTVNQAGRVEEAVANFAKFYPGEIHVVAVANGTSIEHAAHLRHISDLHPHLLTVLEEPKNLGYGIGANLGMAALLADPSYDLVGVTNDDVLASVDCLPQLATAVQELVASGQRVGAVGPVSNAVSGQQLVQLGPYATVPEMQNLAAERSRIHHSMADQTFQVRGLMFLATRECLDAIGGFDPIFGLGNFEDDDWNVRARLAGFSLWIIPGAFLHHEGSTTFKSLEIDYERNIVRNLAIFLAKWKAEDHTAQLVDPVMADGASLYVPFDAKAPRSEFVITINGELVDLVHQASEFDLAAWIVTNLRDRPREERTAILAALRDLGVKH